MSPIECRNCGYMVSEETTICPNCGEALSSEMSKEILYCEDCGHELSIGTEICPDCGCPVKKSSETASDGIQKTETADVSFSVNKSTLKKIIIGVAAFVLLIITVVTMRVVSKNSREKRVAEEYATNLKACVSTMYTGGITAEKAGSLIHDVWYNTIYEVSDFTTDAYTVSGGKFNDDFNVSLAILFGETTFQKSISNIEKNQTDVAEYMKKLKNPPDEYRDAHEAVKDLYDAYLELTECAVNPTGSLTSYTSTFNSADSDFAKYYKLASAYK